MITKEDIIKVLKKLGIFILVSVFAFFIGAIGTAIHRAGVDSFPGGIIVALLLTFTSAYVIRMVTSKNYSFAFTFFIAMTTIFFATSGTNNDVMVLGASLPGSSALSGYVGYIWLFGSVLLAAICSFLPDNIFKKKAAKISDKNADQSPNNASSKTTKNKNITSKKTEQN